MLRLNSDYVAASPVASWCCAAPAQDIHTHSTRNSLVSFIHSANTRGRLTVALRPRHMPFYFYAAYWPIDAIPIHVTTYRISVDGRVKRGIYI